jgi:hypothetical protein
MRRYLSIILRLVAILPLLAAVGLLIGAQFRSGCISYTYDGDGTRTQGSVSIQTDSCVLCSCSCLMGLNTLGWEYAAGPPLPSSSYGPYDETIREHHALGFILAHYHEYARASGMPPEITRAEVTVVAVPHYWLILLTALFPAFLTFRLVRSRHRRRHRLAQGLCPVCAYDLCAHKAGDKCPECGTLILSLSR